MIQIFDGAIGTMLQNAGMKPGDCPELLNVTNPELVQQVHRAYFEAGSDIIETNTFGASKIKLAEYGLSDRMEEINRAAVQNVKIASGGKVKVAGAMGPTGGFIQPLGELDFDDVYQNYLEQRRFWLLPEPIIF